ncbi:MAG: carbon monoxide dehydrogenase subunit G [Rhodobacteraceae bacterium]|nr:carbon monoxide dehydrogenase subunit G [Paracoccaceae bacterium]
MELTGGYDLQASKESIWDALNSTDRLQRIIPGCTSVERVGENSFKAEVVTRVGPLKVKFAGKGSYTDLVPFDSFKITGQGEGGPAGFAKGSVEIELTAVSDEITHLSYKVHSSVGGKLAAVGSRLLEAISKRNIDLFFAGLQRELNGKVEIIDSKPIHKHKRAPALGSTSNMLQIINTLSFVAMAVALWVIALS